MARRLPGDIVTRSTWMWRRDIQRYELGDRVRDALLRENDIAPAVRWFAVVERAEAAQRLAAA